MRYAILGPLEVRDGTRTVPLAQGRQRLLLAVLLLHANEAVSSDRLIDALWGEAPPPTAARSLHNLVSGLRKALANGDVVTQGHGYLLRVADGELDAEHFEALVAQGRADLEKADVGPGAARLREALALWRGPVLADLAYERALEGEAARLEEQRLGALEDRIEADLALGLHVQLAAELEALIAQHPLRERLRGQQILTLYRCGRQADALRAYGDARRALVDELGLEPGPALRRLEAAVLEHDPALGVPDALPPRPAPRAARRPGATGFVARMRARPIAVLAAGGVLVVAAVVAVVLTTQSPSRPAGLGSVAGNSVAAIDPNGNRIVAEVPLGGTPTSLAVDAHAVWALDADDQTIARVDPHSGRLRTFAIGATPTDLAADRGALWVASGEPSVGADHVARLGGDALAQDAPIALPAARHQGAPGAPGQLALGAGALWAINGGEDLARIDPRTGRVTATVRGLRAGAVAADRDSVWVLAADGTTIVGVDPRTAVVRSRLRIAAARLDAIAVGAGAVWAADAYDGTLWRIDPGPRPITRTIPVGLGADGVAVGAGAVWVINSLGGTLVRVDPRGNRTVATIAVGHTPSDVAVNAGRVWVALGGGAGPVAASAAGSSLGPRPLPAPACSRVFSAGGRTPDVLIASDLPLKAGPEFDLEPVAKAVAFVVRQHGFRAGRYSIGYQSCDASTAVAGQSDPKKCQANAKAYAAAPAVLGIVGPYNSPCAEVEIPILNGAKGGPLAVISPFNSQVGLTHRDALAPRGALARLYPAGVRNYARVYPPDDAEAAADAILARRLGLRRVFVLDDQSDVGRELALHFAGSARSIGLGVAGRASWDPGGAGFRALADRVRRAGADGVFLGGLSGSNGGPLTRTLRARLGPRTPLIAGNPFGPVDFLFDDSGGAAKGMYISSPGLPIDRLGASGRGFLRDFEGTQPGVPVSDTAVYAAAGTEVLLDAIARSDGTRPSVSRRLLATRRSDGILGPVRFDANGDQAGPPVTIMRVLKRDGVSDVAAFEGAAIDRIIAPPRAAIR